MFKLTEEQQRLRDEKNNLLDELKVKLKEVCCKISNSNYDSKEELNSLYLIKKDIKKQFDDLIYDDLFLVGKNKALGYLPISTIEDFGRNVDYFKSYAKRNYLKSILISECNIGSGAFYIYDEEMLSAILQDNKKILKTAKVPYKCRDYVKYIASNTVCCSTYPEAYIVVGKTFNDIRFRN